jgi:hypothetical protein
MLIDVDGPDRREYEQGREMSIPLLKELLEEIDRPFGHGYVAAWSILEAVEKERAKKGGL